MEQEEIINQLDSQIELMSQETADEIIDAFGKFNENIETSRDMLERFNSVVSKEMARQVVDKFIVYVEKYTCATFVTRWYWKRKAFKMAQAVKEVSNFLNEGL